MWMITTLVLWQDTLFYWNEISAVSEIIPPSHAIQFQSKQLLCLRECWVVGTHRLWSDQQMGHAIKREFGSVCKQVLTENDCLISIHIHPYSHTHSHRAFVLNIYKDMCHASFTNFLQNAEYIYSIHIHIHIHISN